MKKKQHSWNANSQEDEDGFNLNPYIVIVYDSTNGQQDFSTASNTTISANGAANLTMISSKEKNKYKHYSLFFGSSYN